MKEIGAVVGAAVAGMFVGALVVEVIHRVRPELIKEIGSSTKKTFRTIGAAFKEGYRGKEGVKETAEADA